MHGASMHRATLVATLPPPTVLITMMKLMYISDIYDARPASWKVHAPVDTWERCKLGMLRIIALHQWFLNTMNHLVPKRPVHEHFTDADFISN